MNTKIITSSEKAFDSPLLIKNLLLSGKRYSPKNEIVSGNMRYDYRELYKRICRLANVLIECGVQAGDTVAVMDWDSHRYLEAYFAVPMIGAVLHHVNIRLSIEQISYTMVHAEDQYLLVHNDFLPIVEEISEQLPSLKGCIQLCDDAHVIETDIDMFGEYEELLSQSSPEFDFPDFDEQSVATMFYTTGTTGYPKGVYFTHRQLVLHTLTMSSTLAVYDGTPLLRSSDVYMPMTPMFHVHAWGIPYVATMIGIKQVYPGKYEPNRLLELYSEEKVTFSHGVPTVLQMLLDCEKAEQTDFSSWKLLTGGTAPNEKLVKTMLEKGVSFFTGYGMSETCPVITISHLTLEETNLGIDEQVKLRMKTGLPVPMVELRVLDDDGQHVDFDDLSVGEVQVRAPWLTQGYYRAPQESEKLWNGGWLHTGDIASISENGAIQIRDRLKDVIKTGGEWISSLELESLINNHPEVSMSAVVGIPDTRWDERPVALVVCHGDKPIEVDTIKAHLLEYVASGLLNKWAIPEHVLIVESIPTTSVGKVDKKRIRQNLSDRLFVKTS